MAGPTDDIIINRLFIAVPDAFFEKKFTRYLRRRGLIDDEALANFTQMQRQTKRINSIRNKMQGQSFFNRLLAVAPEVLNRRTVDWFQDTGFIDRKNAATLKLLLRTAGLAKGGVPTSMSQVALRAGRLMSMGYMDDALELMVAADRMELKQANTIRALVLGGSVSSETLARILRAKSIADGLMLIGNGLVDARTIRALKLVGLLDNRTANAMLSALGYGRALWTVFEGSRRAEGLAARMAYVASGTFSWELVDFVKAAGPAVGIELKPYQIALMQMGVALSQTYNRRLMEQMTDRKFRVVPGESPIVTYFRTSHESEKAIMRLLAEAAEDARRNALRLAQTPARGAEYALRARALHQAMRQVWEGTGYITIFGEEQVANAAIEAGEDLQRVYGKHMDPFVREMMQFQARSGLDSYISRKENTLPLSRRVYGNLNLWTGKVDKEINKGLLTGQSAQEIAGRVQSLINPNVMGGQKYAAMRLGRTELSNAFHLTTIRSTREMPWIKGYKWHKSSSHKRGDICDEYADSDHDNLGPGVFKKRNVPDKPHPQCMCYVTAVGVDEKDFIKFYNKGYYNQYINSRIHDVGVREAFWQRLAITAATGAGAVAGTLAWSKGLPALANMIVSSTKGNKGMNPVAISMEVAEQKAKRPDIVNPFPSSPVFASMVDDINLRNKELDLSPLTKDETDRIADAVDSFEDRMKGAEGDLYKRQTSFTDLGRLRSRYVTKGLTTADGYDDNIYRTIIDHDSSVRFHDDDIVSLGLYGSSSYRKINTSLRRHGSSLDGLDDDFGDYNHLFGEINRLDKNDINYKNHLSDTLMDFGDHHGIHPADLVDPNASDDELFLGSFGNIIQDWPADKKFGMGSIHRVSDVVRTIDKRMEPSTKDAFLYRISGPEFYGLGGRMPEKKDIGHIFQDDAFVSTEGVRHYFKGTGPMEQELGISIAKRPTRMQIFTPEGTMMTRVNDFEHELLLGRGSKFQILDVIDEDIEKTGFAKTINLSLIGQNQDIYKAAKKASEDDMWDDIFADI